jgi:hypothetical protein
MNPLLLNLLRPFLTYAIAAAMGAIAAWSIQGVRLDASRNELTAYKQQQITLTQEAKDAADKQRDQARENFTGAVKVLAADIEAGAAYNRCLAAGKCGSVVSNLPTRSGLRLPTAGSVDATGTDAVPAARDPAPEVVSDCASTTLMLNQLQTNIENQPDYKE